MTDSLAVSRGRALLLVAAFCCLAGAGCDAKPEAEDARVSHTLCAAAADARAGHRDPATASFDDVHADLHELAARLAEDDREAADRLLRTKERVEADIRSGAGGDPLAAALEDLARVTSDVQGQPAPEACR